MFLNHLKDFLIKKTVKKSFQNLKSSGTVTRAQTIGLLVDSTVFAETDLLIKGFLSYGILTHNIQIIVYNNNLKRIVDEKHPTFNAKNFNWKGQINSFHVNEFIEMKFDLLVSYYDIEKAILLKITHNSKAEFKVGFSAIDKRLNHLIIKTEVNNYNVFLNELFKYLKLLNKI